MRGSPESLAALRLLLTERFPQAAPRPAAVLSTGVAAIDDIASGGLPVGGITEVVSLAPSSGGQLLISGLLASTRARRMRAALVDARDAFDPQSHEPPLLQHLVWVRSRTLDEAMHAADILVRDANLALVMLDLRGLEVRALRRVPTTTWYRLQRALERTDMAMVVFTAENREIGKPGNREAEGEIESRKSEIGNGNHGPRILLRQAFEGQARRDPTPFSNAGLDLAAPSRSLGESWRAEPEHWRRLASGPSGLVEGAAPAFAAASVGRPSAPLGLVGSARLRLSLANAFALSAFDEERSRLASTLPAEVQRSRVHEERRIA